ncbi:terpene synthase family protein [Streptomyces caatingaensis]|uniref:Terpene synthase n=1 Tax=Streptomyces caatingaensis TaxID=1678637 RepID=A0A0K9XLW7_9ACTN|nr:hypothetical protein [Streptomyces caatingaensis]KNB54096.1 hypothetical protein AC230_06090 [Streptomyces caatingaensis]
MGRGGSDEGAGAGAARRGAGGAEFTVPDFRCPFPGAVNPALPEASGRMWRWVEAQGLAATAEARAVIEQSWVDRAAARYFPTADAGVLALACRWFAWMVRNDDVHDVPAPGARERSASPHLDRLIASAVTGGDGGDGGCGVFGAALGDLWRRTAAGRSPGWCARLAGDFADFLRAYRTERDAAAGPLPGIEEYLRHRTVSYGMLFSTNFAELAAGDALPEEVRACPEFRELRRLTGLHGAIVNDIYSYPRELRSAYPYNAVHLLRSAHGGTVQEAVDRAAALTHACLDGFLAAESRLVPALAARGAGAAARAAALRTVSVMKSMIRGNIDWCHEVPRYASAPAGA